MNKEDALENFLGGYPDSTHTIDRKRFVTYAISCIKDDAFIDEDKMRDSKKVSEDMIHDYIIAFEWIRDAYEYMVHQIQSKDEIIR